LQLILLADHYISRLKISVEAFVWMETY